MASEFKLPELGENIVSGKLTRLLVSVGDRIEKDQPVMELETDKAVIEVPCDKSGIIKEVAVKEGQEVTVGDRILVLEQEGKAGEVSPPKKEPPSPVSESIAPSEKKPAVTVPGKTRSEKKKAVDKSQPVSEQAVTFSLPELGENVQGGTVTKVLVSPGEKVEANQNVLELETDKAVIEVPVPFSGTVSEILIKEGDPLAIGQAILGITRGVEPTKPSVEAETAPPPGDQRMPSPPLPAEKGTGKAASTAQPAPAGEREEISQPPVTVVREPKEPVPAAPSVRRFAREIGIDISHVPGTGAGNRISIEDVKNYSKIMNRQKAAGSTILKGVEAERLPDFTRWGAVDRQPMNKVRESTARHLGYAWATIPHVTQFDKADITELEKQRKFHAPAVEAAGGKLTMTVILLKVIAVALKKYPQFNASIDMEKFEIIYKQYINIGIAVDTDRGLLVPVVRQVDRKNITQLAVELTGLAARARDRKLSLDDMQGGNFSISNLGGIGGTGFTPVVNAPEVAILGVSRSEMQPVYIDGEFQPRLMLPLSLSYDHRLIDGADAARFLRWVAETLQQPFRLLLEG